MDTSSAGVELEVYEIYHPKITTASVSAELMWEYINPLTDVYDSRSVTIQLHSE